MRKKVFVLLFLAACGPANKPDEVGVESLSAAQFEDSISDDIVLLDVRTPQEYEQGFIPGALNLDYKSASFGARLDSLDKSTHYLVYCASGVRSSKASDLMLQKGFTSISVLDGGIDAWVAEGHPVKRD